LAAAGHVQSASFLDLGEALQQPHLDVVRQIDRLSETQMDYSRDGARVSAFQCCYQMGCCLGVVLLVWVPALVSALVSASQYLRFPARVAWESPLRQQCSVHPLRWP